MIDAARYDKIETLKNGPSVRVRSVRADDKNRFSEAFRNLESESIYTRFFHHKKALSADELRAATEVDFETVVALVVTVGEGAHEAIIGAARYALIDPGSSLPGAEVAFAVEEDYHGRGMAGLLLRHLAAIAREKGVSRFEAEVLPENSAMLAVFSRCGLPMKKVFGSGAVHVTLSLAAELNVISKKEKGEKP